MIYVFAPDSLPKIIKPKSMGRLWFLADMGSVIYSAIFRSLFAAPLFKLTEGRGRLYCLSGKRKTDTLKRISEDIMLWKTYPPNRED